MFGSTDSIVAAPDQTPLIVTFLVVTIEALIFLTSYITTDMAIGADLLPRFFFTFACRHVRFIYESHFIGSDPKPIWSGAALPDYC